ncbi:LPXTG cell wall anchor domain-containing protein [Streptococcus pneumoniae]
MNKNSVKFGLASACLTSAILFGVHTVEASDQSSNIQQNESDSYGKDLTTYKAETTKYELDKKAYEAELKAYNESVAKYEADKAEYDRAVLANKELTTKYEADKAAYEKAKAEYDKVLAANKETLTKYESDLSEYNKQKAEADKVKAEYEKLKAEWDAKKAQYEKDKAAYDKAQTDYNMAKADYDVKLATYNTKLAEYNKQVKSNEAADKIENDKRRAEYNEKLKKFEEESKKPGRFASEEKNYLIFVKEPNAKISIEVKDTGDTGALAMIKDTAKDFRFWQLNHKKLSSDQLSDEALAKNNLTDKIIKRWDETVTGYREYGKDPHITTYPVIAKKDRPFTVTYTNLENTTYDKKKVTRIDYEYTVLDTGSSVDTMQISPAYDPTISVSIYGDLKKHGYSTRVRMKPTLYLEDGTKVIPTKEKPIMFAVSSMNTGWNDYSWNSSNFADNKDMFKEFYGKSGVYEEYLNDEFKKLYNVDIETASKPGGLLSAPAKRQEWGTKKAELKQAYQKDEEEYKKDGFKKVKDYMTNKYGSNVNTWPSTYREIVYAIHNASFIKLNESFVDKHGDGIYADKTLDEINSGNPVWDNQESPYKYRGAGVIKVTEDGFYLEFGATVPFTQLFGINTAIVDEYIEVKPKLELVETPKPTPPTPPIEPKQPELKEPTPLGVAPKEPNKFDKEKPVKPDLKEPTPPTRPVEPPKVEKPVEPPKVEKPTKQVETLKEEIPTKLVEPPKEEKPTLPRTGSASDMSMTVVGLLTTLASFFVFTKRKDESNK